MHFFYLVVAVILSLSRVQHFVTPWTVAHQAPLSSTISWSLLKFMSIESVVLSNHLILWFSLFPLPSLFPSIRVFSIESSHPIWRPDYWSFHFSISPSNKYSGLIFFRTGWVGFLSVQGTLKCFLQHHTMKASVCQCSAFFVIQLSHPYRTIGKTVALTVWTFVGKVMFLLFHTRSRFLIALLSRRKLL